ncbi:MAG: endo alpha-1,4 polygalactosaminidase, partial [Pseudomonadota bacterium]
MPVTNFTFQYSAVPFSTLSNQGFDMIVAEVDPVSDPLDNAVGPDAQTSGISILSAQEVQALKNQGTEVFGYLSAGVVSSDRSYFEADGMDWFSGNGTSGTPTSDAPNFIQNGRRLSDGFFAVDTDATEAPGVPTWEQIVLRQVKDLLDRGFDGIYLDDGNRYFVENDVAATSDNASALIDLVASVRALIDGNPVTRGTKIFINTSPNILGDAQETGDPTFANSINGIVLESQALEEVDGDT